MYWFYLLSETFFNEMSYVHDLFNIMDLNCNLNFTQTAPYLNMQKLISWILIL